ncbi:MAG: iron uptake porin [Pleurocapsa sp.]
MKRQIKYLWALGLSIFISSPAFAQIPAVEQLRDVRATDWAFAALQSLAQRYGCITGYPDGTYRGDRSVTRYEFAVALNSCLNSITELTASGNIAPEDVSTLQKLQQYFGNELAILRGRVDGLQARTTDLEAQQFSTTTKLTGQGIFAFNAGGFEGERIIDPNGLKVTDDNPNATTLYRIALDFNSSFIGTDLLKIRIDTGSNGGNDNATGFLEPNLGSVLDYSVKPPSDGNFGIARLFYSFQPIEGVRVSIGPDMRISDYIDRNSYANLSFRDFSTQALINNFILLPLDGPVAGANIEWQLKSIPLALRATYGASDAANPGDKSQPIRGVASFSRLIYSNTGSLGDRGLFGATYQGAIELEYLPIESLALRVQYAGGEVFDNRFDAFGVNAEWTIIPQVAIFGRYGFATYADTAFDKLHPDYWMAGIAFPDLIKPGATGAIAISQPFIESEIGNATQLNFEAYYNFPFSENISLTPTFQVVSNAANQDDNGTIYSGTLRTVFSF